MQGPIEPKKIGEILVSLKVLSHFDVSRVLEALRKRQRRQKFGQMARDMGLLGDEHILAALAVQMRLLPGIEQMSLRQILDQLQSEPTSV
jgi:hypothetical protein